MTITRAQGNAIVARYPQTVAYVGNGILHDLEAGSEYTPPTVRHALAWIAAGESDNDGGNSTDPKTSRLARWWRMRA